MQEIKMRSWNISVSDDGTCLYIKLDGFSGETHIKAEDAGFVVDIYTNDLKLCVGSTFALYTELES